MGAVPRAGVQTLPRAPWARPPPLLSVPGGPPARQRPLATVPVPLCHASPALQAPSGVGAKSPGGGPGMMPAYPPSARHGDLLPSCSPPPSGLVDAPDGAQLPPHPAPCRAPPSQHPLPLPVPPGGGLGSTRRPQARPRLGSKMKVGSDVEREPGPPHTLLAPSGGRWAVGCPRAAEGHGGAGAVLRVIPSLPSTPLPHSTPQWVALWAWSTAPHIEWGGQTGC